MMARLAQGMRPGNAWRRRWLPALVLFVALVVVHKEILRIVKFGTEVSFSNIRLSLSLPDAEIALRRADGIRLSASLYQPRQEGRRPAVLLLHGSTVRGRQLALYRLLGRGLADRGYLVLSPDFAGFGSSQNPFEADDPAVIDGDRDVLTALDWLLARDDVDPRRVFLLGHSGGSVFALNVALHDSRVRALALIGPPRNVIQRLSDRQQVEYFFARTRQQWLDHYQRDFPPWYTIELWYKEVMGSGASTTLLGDLGRYLPYFSGANHLPLLLVDGSREFDGDLYYLDIYAAAMSEPKRHLRLANGDHFGNTFNWLGLVLSDATVAEQLLTGIDGWFSSAAPRGER